MPLLYSMPNRSLAALCALSLALGLVACDSDDDADPDTTEQETTEADDPSERQFDHTSLMESYGAEFGTDSEVLFSVASFEHIFDAVEELDADAFVAAMGPEMKEAIGVNILDRDSVETTGIDTDGHIFIGGVNDNPMVCTIVDDQDTFDEFMVSNLAVAIHDQAADDKDSSEIADHSVHHVGEALAWVHRDDDSCFLQQVVPESGGALDSMEAFLTPEEDAPRMADSDAFGAYLGSDATDGLFALYADEEIIFSDIMAGAAPFQLRTFVESMVDAQGARLAIDDGAISIRSWTNADGPEAETVQRLLTSDADIDWARFASDDLGAALRLSLHGPTVMDMIEDAVENFMADMAAGFMESLPEDARGDIDGDDEALFSDEMRSLLSGHAAVFFYGLDNPVQAMAAPDGLLQAEALVAIQLGDAEMVHGWIEELEPSLADFNAELRALTNEDGDHDDIQVIASPEMPVWIALSDDLLVIAPQGLSEAQFATLVDDTEAGASVADSHLGSSLLDDNFNGLYLGSGLWQTLGDMPDAEMVARHLDESRLTFEAIDESLYIDVDIYPGEGLLNLLAESQ